MNLTVKRDIVTNTSTMGLLDIAGLLRNSELAKHFLLGLLSVLVRLFFVGIVSDIFVADTDKPFSVGFVPGDSVDSTGISVMYSVVPCVFSVTAFPQIAASIVKRIVVAVIRFIIRSAADNKAVHVNINSFFSASHVEAACSVIPKHTPIPLIKPFVVSGIDDSVLALRQGNQTNRLIFWLRNRVSFHVAGVNTLRHGVLPKGLCATQPFYHRGRNQ